MVAVKIRIAKPIPGVQLKKAVDLPGLTETPVKLSREGAADWRPLEELFALEELRECLYDPTLAAILAAIHASTALSRKAMICPA